MSESCTIIDFSVAQPWYGVGKSRKPNPFGPPWPDGLEFYGQITVEYVCDEATVITNMCKLCAELVLEDYHPTLGWGQSSYQPSNWFDGTGGQFPMSVACGQTHQFNFNIRFQIPVGGQGPDGKRYRIRLRLGETRTAPLDCDWELTEYSPEYVASYP